MREDAKMWLLTLLLAWNFGVRFNYSGYPFSFIWVTYFHFPNFLLKRVKANGAVGVLNNFKSV